MTTDLELEDLIAATLHRHGDRLGEPGSGLPDVRRRLVRRRRAHLVAGAAALAGIGLAAGLAVHRNDSPPGHVDETAPGISASETSLPTSLATTTLDGVAPTQPIGVDTPPPVLWPDHLPDGATFVEVRRYHNESFNGKAPIVGLLARANGDSGYTLVRLEVSPSDIQGPSDRDEPVAIPGGSQGLYTKMLDGSENGVLRFQASGHWVYLTGAVPPADLADLASLLQVAGDGAVTMIPRNGNGWLVLQEPRDLTGAAGTALWFEVGPTSFVVSVSWAPPDLVELVPTMTIEDTDEGPVWHIGGWAVLHRADGLWIVVGRGKLALTDAEKTRVLLSMRPATADEAARFEPVDEGPYPGDPECAGVESRYHDGRLVIAQGDYLNLIASCLGVPLHDLMDSLSDPTLLVGDTIVIPTTVPPG